MDKAPSPNPTVALLEAVGSDNPQQLDYLLRVMVSSPAECIAIGTLAVRWGVDLQELGPHIVRTLATLDTLERRRAAKHPPSMALLQLGLARSLRVTSIARRRRLERLSRRIWREHLAKLRADRIRAFISRPGGPVDLAEWLPKSFPGPKGSAT